MIALVSAVLLPPPHRLRRVQRLWRQLRHLRLVLCSLVYLLGWGLAFISLLSSTLSTAALAAPEPSTTAAAPNAPTNTPGNTPGNALPVQTAAPVTVPATTPTGKTHVPTTGPRSAAGANHLKADHVLIEKSARRLSLIADGQVIKTYQIALGRHPTGAKLKQGDGRTPEGFYTIDARNPNSTFHRALHISYPNEQDKARAAAAGVKPGGQILIHGIRNGLGFIGALHRRRDWTSGCVAVTNPEIDEIWDAVADGTPVEIRP